MIGTLNEELNELFKKMDKLTMKQADNLAELITDLPAEHAFALGTIVKNNQQCTMKIEDADKKKFEGDQEGLGMFAHKKFVDRINIVKAARDAIALDKKKEEEVTTTK